MNQWDDLTDAEWRLIVLGEGCTGLMPDGRQCGRPAPLIDPETGKRVCADHYSGPRCEHCQTPVMREGDTCYQCAGSIGRALETPTE